MLHSRPVHMESLTPRDQGRRLAVWCAVQGAVAPAQEGFDPYEDWTAWGLEQRERERRARRVAVVVGAVVFAALVACA